MVMFHSYVKLPEGNFPMMGNHQLVISASPWRYFVGWQKLWAAKLLATQQQRQAQLGSSPSTDAALLPSGYVKIAMEHGHRNGEFSHLYHGDFPWLCTRLPEQT